MPLFVRTIRESVIESCFHMGSESLVAGIIKGLTPIHVIVVLHDILFFQKLGANLVCDLLEGTILVDAHDMPLHVQVGCSLGLVLGGASQSTHAAEDSAEWPHIASEHILATVEVVVATGTIWAHAHTQELSQKLHLDPVGIDDR